MRLVESFWWTWWSWTIGPSWVPHWSLISITPSFEACPAALLLALLSCGARAASARRHELLEQWNEAFAAPCRQASFYPNPSHEYVLFFENIHIKYYNIYIYPSLSTFTFKHLDILYIQFASHIWWGYDVRFRLGGTAMRQISDLCV